MSLPGVETARRRRASHGHSSASSSSFSTLRLIKHTSYNTATSIIPALQPQTRDNSLLGRAMAARQRLDQKLSNLCTRSSIVSTTNVDSATTMQEVTTTTTTRHCNQQVLCSNKVTLREERLLFPRLGGQEECPICLESFLTRQMVTYLPCQHSFHQECLLPWLQTHCHCPVCRAKITN